MYIHPIVAGVALTILAELALVIVYAWYDHRKGKKK